MQNIYHPLLDAEGIRAFYTVRGDVGATPGPYDGFNVCHYTGDAPAHVERCRRELASWAGVGEDNVVIPRQTHSVRVAVIGEDGVPSTEGVDALVTRRHGVVIGVNTADCVPVVMADPVARVIGVAHAGWRGAVGGIVGNTVAAMIELGAAMERLRVVFGPSICTSCFEVGEEVAARFPESAVKRRPEWVRPHVDLHGYITSELISLGVCASAVAPFDRSLCTRCHPARFFSAHAQGVASGRVFTFAYLG